MKLSFIWILILSIITASASSKPRLLVLTDIGQDPDDQQSLIRLLHYANDFDIVGLVATADKNYKKEPPTIKDYLIHEAIDRYGKIHANLLKHDPNYPASDALSKTVKKGNNLGGNEIAVFETIGPDKDTEGSDWIIQMGDNHDGRPLNIAIWGGACDFAQALWRLRQNRSPEEVAYWVSDIRVHAIGDQDNTSIWIREEFPNLFYIHDFHPGGNSLESAYRGIFLEGDYETLSKEWLYENIKENHGPLGGFYPDKAWTQDNPHGTIKEGDTPSWFYFLRNGLQDPGRPDFGGWGGRFKKEGNVWRDQQDTVGDVSFRESNHPPIALLNGRDGDEVIYLDAAPGDPITLSAIGSSDPDIQSFTIYWYHYVEAGSFSKSISISTPRGSSTSVQIPQGASGKTIHIILEVRDSGSPSLVAYRRVVLVVR
jgi:hypothetical protein